MPEELLNLQKSNNQVDLAMKPRIILCVKDEKRRDGYLVALEPLSECTLTDSLKSIPDILRQGPYEGILIDVYLNIKASYMEKVKISDSLDAMPSATVNFDARSGSIRLLMLNQDYGTARSLEEFTVLCSIFQPKIIYPHNQDALNLNALLSPTPNFDVDIEYTFTTNISGGGCFLFTASQTGFQPQDMVWIDFVGLDNRNPIQGKICWKCSWGVSHSVPGIYVSFESILEAQFKEIKSLIARKKELMCSYPRH
jgi:hypothetical protein